MGKIISPTGLRVRQGDNHGSGVFCAPRSWGLHRGADFICKPGQIVVSPIGGSAVREARPYSDHVYGGILLLGDHIKIKMFYLQVDSDLLRAMSNDELVSLWPRQPIGIAQNIGKRLVGITPHIHCEITQMALHNNKEIEVFIDPESLL